VVVAAGALKRKAEEAAGRVLDGLIENDIAVEDVPVARQKSGGAKRVGIRRRHFIARQHLDNHLS